MSNRIVNLLTLLLCPLAAGAAEKADFAQVPGVVIDHSPAVSASYVGSPSLAILPDGTYIASHDYFGKGGGNNRTSVFASSDQGRTWTRRADLVGQWWSTLFVHRGDLYLMGVDREWGRVVIRRSADGGKTWTTPSTRSTGLLLTDGKFHCAPGAVLTHSGRVWRAIEDAGAPGGRAHFRPFVLSAPVDADLLDAANWTRSAPADPGEGWLGGEFHGWLEGNVVPTPDGRLVNLLRVNRGAAGETAAVVRVSDDGRTASFDPARDFIPFPGGNTKFTVRRDPRDGAYWSLSNYVLSKSPKTDAGHVRNTLALVRSTDLVHWAVRCIVLYHPDAGRHAFQYVDWQFDGDDIIAASRTAYDDGLGGARNFHDANFLTFHRISGFRSLTAKDSVPTPAAAPVREELKDCVITGTNFCLASLDDDATAFSNRDYVWRNVPAKFRGWRYTQTAGGTPATITVRATRDLTLFAATAAAPARKAPALPGWTPVRDLSFNYTDRAQTRMDVYARRLAAGETVAIPDGGWSGTILLLPPAPER